MTVYINGVLQPQPIQWVAWVSYADTAGRCIVIADNGMVLS